MSILFFADGPRREALGEWAEEALFAGTVLAAPAQNAYSHRFPSLKLAAVIGCAASGGIGESRQIGGASGPHGEQVKMPGRSSQLGRLR
jgi:hypothetical protein